MFKNVDAEVVKSTRYIALIVLTGSLLMEAVFLIIGWDWRVLTGNLLGALTAIANFFLMAQTVAKILAAGDKKQAEKRTMLSRSLRMLMMAAAAVLGFVLPSVFNPYAVIVPLLFPSVGAMLSRVLMKAKK